LIQSLKDVLEEDFRSLIPIQKNTSKESRSFIFKWVNSMRLYIKT